MVLAIVSAFVFNNCPFPSCVIAQKTGVKSALINLSIEFEAIFFTSPTKPKSMSLTGLFSDCILLMSAPVKPMASICSACNFATTFLLTKPP